MQLTLQRAVEARTHDAPLSGRVPVARGGDGAVVGGESDDADSVAVSLARASWPRLSSPRCHDIEVAQCISDVRVVRPHHNASTIDVP
jgi:hypothetical protein